MPVSNLLSFLKVARLVGLGLILLPPNLKADDALPGITAKILPCAGPCGGMQWGQLEIGRIRDGHIIVTTATSMQNVDEIHINEAGYFVAVGHMQAGWSVVEVINPLNGKALTEFWTAHWGISPNARYVAFTEMIATHGQDSEYSDKMVYVYDTTKGNLLPESWVNRPGTAVPVYPSYLVEQGLRNVMAIPAQRFPSVVSTNFEWLSPDEFYFITDEPASLGTSSHYVPTVVAAGPGSDWHHAAIIVSAARIRCDPVKLDTESIMAACKNQAAQ